MDYHKWKKIMLETQKKEKKLNLKVYCVKKYKI